MKDNHVHGTHFKDFSIQDYEINTLFSILMLFS